MHRETEDVPKWAVGDVIRDAPNVHEPVNGDGRGWPSYSGIQLILTDEVFCGSH